MSFLQKRKKLLSVILGVVLLLFIVIIPIAIAIFLYETQLDQRYETPVVLQSSLTDFDGLQAERHTFPSNDDQQLVGYTYTRADIDPQGVIVLAHGLGGGHNSYLNVANYFTEHGYIVFGFDNTGSDESEGASSRGIPQAVIDLDYALRYLKQDPRNADLPMMLFGHSLGGYAVCSVLADHPDVAGVVSVAGFESSPKIVKSFAEEMLGPYINLVMPYFSIYERIKFGSAASYRSTQGLQNSQTPVLIIHSEEDEVVPVRIGYDIYWDAFQHDDRFTFSLLPGNEHHRNYIFRSSESQEHFRTLIDEMEEHDFVTMQEKYDYIGEHLDRSLWNELDESLMADIVSFYDNCTNGK